MTKTKIKARAAVKQVLVEGYWLTKVCRAQGEELPPRERKAFMSSLNCPIKVVEGDKAPELVGERPHYETIFGERVRDHLSYSRHGWEYMVYIPSTRHIEVGMEWLRERGLPTEGL